MIGIQIGINKLWGSAAAPAAPSLVSPPTITGTAGVGYTLMSDTGTWDGVPTPTYSYQWQRAGVDIGGETANTYTQALADQGLAIRCVVTATNTEGSASANSDTRTPSTLNSATSDWYDNVLGDGGTAGGLIVASLNTLVNSWTSAGVWAKRRRINLMVGDQLTAGLVCLDYTRGYSIRDAPTNVDPSQFSPTAGLSGNVAQTSFVDLGWEPMSGGASGEATGLLAMCYRGQDLTGATVGMIGCNNNASQFYEIRRDGVGSTTRSRYGGTTQTAGGGTHVPAIYSTRRASNTSIVIRRDNTVLDTVTTSTTPAACGRTMYILGLNRNGALGDAMNLNRRCAGYACFETMTDTEWTNMVNAWATFNTAIGR